MSTEQFSLCWDNFHKNMSAGMHSMLESGDLVDVTLAVEGKCLKAHKMILSVCSPYFRSLFRTNPCKHPIVFMKDVSYTALSDLLQFMYQGEVQVSQENLSTFIKTAEALQIKGLTGGINEASEVDVSDYIAEDIKQTITSPEKPEQDSETAKTPIPTRVKRQLSGRPAKRPRTSDTETPKTVAEKTETLTTTSRDLVQFKMEPYEISDAAVHEPETSADDDTSFAANESIEMENVQQQEEEDYSLMSSMEEEPQAGTSGEGAEGAEGPEEGQDFKPLMGATKRKQDMPRYIVDGFVFHVNIMKGNPPMTYLRCLEYKRLGCHARAVIPSDGTIQDIKVNKPHNHPPDYAAEQKIVFLRELKEITLQNPHIPPREAYATLSEMYPIAARETPYELIRHKMNRWRRTVLGTSTSSSLVGSPGGTSVKCEF